MCVIYIYMYIYIYVYVYIYTCIYIYILDSLNPYNQPTADLGMQLTCILSMCRFEMLRNETRFCQVEAISYQTGAAGPVLLVHGAPNEPR